MCFLHSFQTWDDDLESMAADYAKECIWGHGNPDNITPYQHVGQNLAYSRGGAPASPMYLISHWFNEKENYDINTDSCVPGTVCGHYTQVRTQQCLYPTFITWRSPTIISLLPVLLTSTL